MFGDSEVGLVDDEYLLDLEAAGAQVFGDGAGGADMIVHNEQGSHGFASLSINRSTRRRFHAMWLSISLIVHTRTIFQQGS